MKKIMIVSALIIAMTGISTAQADDHGRVTAVINMAT
jgi:uncharacterized protein YraI